MNTGRSIEEMSSAIKEEALKLGFTGVGFSRAEVLTEDADRLKKWLGKGYHARMGYMANHFEKRTDPTLLVEGARTVISLLYNYFTNKKQADPEAPVLSKYAYGIDYHFILKEKMKLLFDYIKTLHPGAAGRIFVDSAPVLDRAWARRAGLGWIGKNSNLISRAAGSFVFIGEIILNLELEYNQVPESDFCGSCTRCIEACPTEAILDNRTIHSERCISYQTIENKGGISSDMKAKLSNRVFGCDICQDVCPWNRNALNHLEPGFNPSDGVMEMSRKRWQELASEEFDALFDQSPLQRAGYAKIKDTVATLQEDPKI